MSDDEPIKRFSELLDLPGPDRIKHELRILEGLMGQAIKDKEFAAAIKIFEQAHTILARNQKR
jgi:hypothetical protein